MLHQLTPERMRVVFETLRQERDRAVYAISSGEKTEIFGRSQGRVNNDLSSEEI